MGKKANWNPSEDQTLTRVWLNASELQPQGGTPLFWTVVQDLFHQEVGTQRSLTGIKVRWTRIHRDSQKFAAIFNRLQSQHMKQAEESGGDSADAVAVALLKEQQWIDEAKSAFNRVCFSKFGFEGCWKQLRYSEKWLQRCANSNANHQVLVVKSLVEEVRPDAPTPVTEQETATTDCSVAADTTVALTTDSPRASEAAAVAEVSISDVDESPSRKRRAEESLEALSSDRVQSPTSTLIDELRRQNELIAHISNDQVRGLTSTFVDELRRQNDLMEDQNAIALLKVDGKTIPDTETRQCYQLLRARYVKKIRKLSSSDDGSSDRSSTSV